MEGFDRQLRWIFGYRVATLGAVAFLLPFLVSVRGTQLPWLVGVALALLLFWNAPFWREKRHGTALPACALALEGILVAALAARFGGASSPAVLLLLPVLAQGAITLPTRTYAAIATTALGAYALLLSQVLEPTPLPYWLPLWGAALVLTAAWLGVAGAVLRRNQALAEHELRHTHRYRGLVEQLPALALGSAPTKADDAFWQSFLSQAARAGGFLSVALVRWDSPRPDVLATDRAAAWQGLVARHGAVFAAGARAQRPQIFSEQKGVTGQQPRAIACWPIPHRADGVRGLLCVMAPAPIELEQAGKRLARFLPIAALALALGSPKLELHRQAVDWQGIVNATLHRLHGRLARYLVLVHVDQGRIDADALLLADAIAHVIEEVLDRTPPMTPVRLTVRHGRDGWRFQVETEHPPTTSQAGPRAGILLARQVVAAHGGAWEQVEETATAFRVGFLLPQAGELQRGL